MFNFDHKDRNLFRVLARMELQASDYHSFLGALWSFFGPFFMFVVTYLIFRDRTGSQIKNFPLMLLSSIICIHYMVGSINAAMAFFSRQRNMLLNSRVKGEVLYLVSAVVPTSKFLVEIGLCLGLAYFYGLFRLDMLPLVIFGIVFFIILLLGLGMLFAILRALAADIKEIWMIVSRAFYFITPTFFTLNMLSPEARFMVRFFNPITPFVLIFQYCCTGQPIPYFTPQVVFQAMLYSVLSLVLGTFCLKKFEKKVIASL